MASTRRSAAAGAAGIAASALYVSAVLAGGALDPNYSHLAEPVGELTSSAAPYRTELGYAFAGYHVAVGLLAIALLRTSARSRSTTWGCVMLLLASAAGLLTIAPFAKDSAGVPVTPEGVVHIALAGFASLVLLGAAFLLARGWRDDPRWGGLAWMSAAVGVGLVLLAPVGFTAVALGSAYVGLFERGIQLLVLAWFVVIGVHAVRPEGWGARAPRRDEGPRSRGYSSPQDRGHRALRAAVTRTAGLRS